VVLSTTRLVRFGRTACVHGALLAAGSALGAAARAEQGVAIPAPAAPRAPDDTPDALRTAVERAIARVYPALVRIHVVQAYYSEGREQKGESAGSGVIVAPEGLVVTNHHVTGRAKRIWCTLSDRSEVEATLVGSDPLADIAVLRLDGAGRGGRPFPVARFGDSSRLRVGDRVLAMGSPRALSQSVTLGIVSNLEMTFPRFFWPATFKLDGEETGSLVRWIGHDAQIFPGNSGGPLVNLEGEIIGINEISLGLAGAIPGNLARGVADELARTGTVRRSWLGLALQPLLKDDRRGRGVLVSSVVADSPAARAGLRAGDVLLAYDGRPLHVRYAEELPDVNRLLLDTPQATEVTLTFLRDGEEHTAKAVTAARGAAQGEEQEVHAWGATLRELTLLAAKELDREPGSGVLVGSVRPGGPASDAKPPLLPGDIVTSVRGTPVHGLEELRALTARALRGAEPPVACLVGFERRSQQLLTVLRLGEPESRDRSAEALKAWLPVSTQVLTPDLAEALGLRGRTGVRVTHVQPGSTAEAAGLKIGDVLLRLDGEDVPASQPEDGEVFAAMVRPYPVGARVRLDAVREGRPLTLDVELASSPPAPRELVEFRDDDFEFAARDLTVQDRLDESLEDGLRGALVTGVDSGGWAALAQLAVGDVILSIDGEPVPGVHELERRMARIAAAQPRRVVVLVRRGVSTLFLELEPAWGAH
jgi:serine protease Do